MGATRELEGLRPVDARLVALLRLVLAIAALAVLEPGRYASAAYVTLCVYSLYCAALLLATLRHRMPVPPRLHPWVDLAAYLILGMLAAGSGQPFLALFFFAVLVASFSAGMAQGFGLATAERRRLKLLDDLASAISPRLSADQAVSQSLRVLREFFRAEACVLVCAYGARDEYVLHRVDGSPRAPMPPQPLDDQSARTLLSLEPEAALANLLETNAFVTVPFGESLRGRLYLVDARASRAELEFLREASERIAAALGNLRLVEQVMQNAAQIERARISRDIHDTTLQPYIGLKLGLEALARKLPPGSPAAPELAELLAMSRQVVADLRGYVAWLRGAEGALPSEHLLAGLREHVGRYRNFYGIDVDLRSDTRLRLTDRVAGEAYQIVCEALSNIHRHTAAKRGFVELHCEDQHLAIEVGNECAGSQPTAPFVPRSIAERAYALGGRAEVRLHHRGHDVVRVAIPL